MNDSEVLEDAVKATARLRKGSHLKDWFLIGAGFCVGVRHAMTSTGSKLKREQALPERLRRLDARTRMGERR
jgi:hypothetical protein